MNIRKIAIVGGFAAAAVAFAPLASADDLSTAVDAEIASLNSIFESQVALAGDTADLTAGGTGVLDTILASDAPATAPFTTLDYELYGLFPSTIDIDPDPSAGDVFDGALAEFYDAANVLAFFFTDNSGDLIPVTDLVAPTDIANFADFATNAAMFGSFLDTGWADLVSFFGAGFL